MLRFCSYLVCEINSQKKIITPNLNKLKAFLTMSKNLDQGPNCHNSSDFAQIQCEELFCELILLAKYEQIHSMCINLWSTQYHTPSFIKIAQWEG